MADTPLIISAEVLGLDSFKALDKTIEAIDSSATELHSTFGKTDKALASSSKAAANTTAKTRRLGRAMEETRKRSQALETGLRSMGEVGTVLADRLEQSGVVMSGPLGAAIAGVVVGIGAAKLAFLGLSKAVEFTTDSIQKFIESDKEAQLEAKKLTQSFDRLTIAFGSAVVGGDNVNEVLRKMALEMDKTTEEIDENAQNINDVFSFVVKALSTTAEKVVNFFSMPVIGFVFLLESIGNLMKLFLREIAFTLRSVAEASVTLAEMLELDTAAAEGLVDTLKDLEDGFDARINLDWAESAETVRAKFSSIMDFARDLVDTTGKPRKFELGLDVDRSQIERGLEWIEDKASQTGKQIQNWLSFPAQKRGRRAPGGKTAAEPTLREFGMGAADEIWPGWRSLPSGLEEAQVEALPAIETTTRAVQIQSEAVDDLGSNWDKLIDISKDFAAALLSVSASMVGGFAAGVGTLSELGDAILDTFADLASNIGDFFLKWGMLEVLVNPGLGAAMIAGAIGLKAFGGFLSGKGSGNRGSGRGGGAAAQADVNRQMARSLTPETDSGPRTIEVSVHIGTKQIEPEIVSIMGQARRLNRLAYQGG